MTNVSISRILENFGLSVNKLDPRRSLRFAIKYFKNKPIKVIEIGVEGGKNSKMLLDNLNINRIYLIDPYIIYDDLFLIANERDKTNQFFNHKKIIAEKRLSKYKDKIDWIRKLSDDAVKDIKEKVDYIY